MKLFFIFIVWMVIAMGVWGQAPTRADRLFERGDYLEALKAYQRELEEVGDKGTEQSDLLKMRVANCFFHLNDVVRAGQMYKAVNPDLMGAEDLTYYAITLLRAGDYDKAAAQVDLAESLGADATIVDHLRGSCEFAREVAKEKPMYTANKTKIDFAGFSSGVTYYKGKSVILAAPGVGEDAVKDSRGYRVTRLFNAVFTGDGSSGRLLPFADELADKYHIGAVTFTKDFKRVYYTRTILKKDGSSILKLMTAAEENGKWGDIRELDINSDDYSCAHPCLYRDSLLYFVSDMPGGMGGKDIYRTTVEGPECGEVQNLGGEVNTVFDELFPFLAEDGKLYFASNGHVGLGGLDVFVSQTDAGGAWGAPQNMGRPINSSMDDFALVFRDPSCAEGYVSSNRGGTGYNDFLFTVRLLSQQRKAPVRTLAGNSKAPGRRQPMMVAGMTEQADSAEPGEPEQKEEMMQHVASQDMFTVDYHHAIQIGAFRNPVPRVYFEKFNNVKVYLGYDNIYRYTVGEYPGQSMAQAELSQVRRAVPDAFVMNVDRYVADRKIQHDVRGDATSDDELLLRRLKNFENEGKKKITPPVKRFLDKPDAGEYRVSGQGYTIVLMSADRVFDPSDFKGLDDVDVYAVERGKYMYCSGLYPNAGEAQRQLAAVKVQGFKDAYILRRESGELYSQSAPRRAPVSRNRQELKELLNF